MSKQLVRIYAGFEINDDPLVFTENISLVNDEKLTILIIEWSSSPPCTSCRSYPSGRLIFTLKLQSYNNLPQRGRKRRSYTVLGAVTIWRFERKQFRLFDWHRISLREAGVIEIPRAINTNKCVISHAISLLGPLVPFVYKPLPQFIEPLMCPPCFEAIDIPFIGVDDDFDASGCLIIPNPGSNAICVPIPDCVPIP